MIIFISGHLKISEEEFIEHYVSNINLAIMNDCSFVVGDARGVDTMAQTYLFRILGEGSPKVTVYHMFDRPRNNVGKFKTKGGYTSDDERDAAMTRESHKDIAWVRPGKETSGTAKNVQRRKNTTIYM